MTQVWVVVEAIPGPEDPMTDSPLFGVCVSKEAALERLDAWIADAYGPGQTVHWEQEHDDHLVCLIASPSDDERVIQITAMDLLEAL